MDIKLFKNMWFLSLKGSFAIIFGILVLLLPDLTLLKLVSYFGIVAIISGLFILYITVAHRKEIRKKNWWLMEGIFDVIIGLSVWLVPDISKHVFIIILSVWIIITGDIQIFNSFQIRLNFSSWWILLINGSASLFLGTALLLFSFKGPWAVIVMMGIFVFMLGISSVILSYSQKNPSVD
ncbi:MAG: DUF308 domain-containing protein [Bacteroidales bacterium]|nr:DUF308 domain-containing protein [Bacteroidales bacterium]